MAQRGIVKVNNATGKVETLDAPDYAALRAAIGADEHDRLRKLLRRLLDGWTFAVDDDDYTEFEAALLAARKELGDVEQ